jgi:hypothetical protein
MPTSTMKWVVVDDLLVVCASAGEAPKEVWDNYVEALKDKRVTCHIAASVGALEVSSLQRKAANEVLKVRGIPMTVLTDSGLVRGLVTAASWLGLNISAFEWGDMRSALRQLKVNKVTEDRAVIALAQLRDACLDKKPGGALKPPPTSFHG